MECFKWLGLWEPPVETFKWHRLLADDACKSHFCEAFP